MPIVLLKSIITDHLSSIGYLKPNKDFSFSPINTLKSTLMSGNGVELEWLAGNKFKARIKAESYYDALTTDFYYSHQKITQHRKVIDSMVSNSHCNAWLLVTAYYQAFYGAIELARLKGTYNTNFRENDIKSINGLFKSGGTLTQPGTYKGTVHSFDNYDNQIEVTFLACGSKPHMVTWINLNQILSSSIDTQTQNMVNKSVARLQSITLPSNHSFLLPSELRNDWNYSRVEAYSPEAHKILNEMQHLLMRNNYKKARNWAEMRISTMDDRQQACGLAYLSTIIENTIYEIRSKILA